MKSETIKFIEKLFKESSDKGSQLHEDAFKDFSVILEEYKANRFTFTKAVKDIHTKYGLKYVSEELENVDDPEALDPNAKKDVEALKKVKEKNLKTKLDIAKQEEKKLQDQAVKSKNV